MNFILQATRILHIGNYNDNDIKMIYEFTKSLDNNILNDYFNKNSIILYENDLTLYLEIVDALIKIFENKEDYEKCVILMNKKKESLDIMNKKTISI